MRQLVLFTQTVFCLVSMALTGLFALSLSGIDLYNLSAQVEVKSTLLLAVLFVLIGVCIDIGKYLFWMQRERSYYYAIISIVLMTFSWLASCAFFMTSEVRLIKSAQTNTSEYSALELRIEGVNQAIVHQERLLNNRLGSSYHSQWEAGQENAKNISALRAELASLIEGESSVGLQEAANQVSTTRFFSTVAEMLNSRLEAVRLTGYGILSLLLEICTLGMISLSQSFSQASVSLNKRNTDSTNKSNTVLLVSEILSGKVPPVLRTILSLKYQLGIDEVKTVLQNLHQAGLLTKDKRNSFKLIEKNDATLFEGQ